MSNDAIRIGDAERDAAVTALGDHYVAGRLTKEEFDERAGRVATALTHRDLRPVFADLPGGGTSRTPARVGRSERGHGQRRGWRPFPALLVPLLVVAGVFTVITKLPFILFALLGLWFLSRMASGCGTSRRDRSAG